MEGKLRTLANPLSAARLENILADLEVAVDENNVEEISDLNDDEVSVLFYGDTCDCSKRSTCCTKSCTCKRAGNLCSQMCHMVDKSSCKNKN